MRHYAPFQLRRGHSEILSGVERVRADTEKTLLDILDKVSDISADGIDDTHIFAPHSTSFSV
jgi:hypothetical protein